jgi:hypothetical protein
MPCFIWPQQERSSQCYIAVDERRREETTGHGMAGRGEGVRVPVGTGFVFLYDAKKVAGTPPAPYPMDIGTFPLGQSGGGAKLISYFQIFSRSRTLVPIHPIWNRRSAKTGLSKYFLQISLKLQRELY